jgi:hypothetical protein
MKKHHIVLLAILLVVGWYLYTHSGANPDNQ